MKQKSIRLILLVILFNCFTSSAQVNYTYDQNGNRFKRELYLGPPNSERSFAPNNTLATKIPNNAKASQLASDFGITIYPSQVKDLMNFTILSANQNTPALVTLYDNLGKEIYKKKVQVSSEQQISLSHINNGIYNLSVVIKNQQVFYKIIKE